MLEPSDVATYFRDLFYTQEDFIVQLQKSDLPTTLKQELQETAVQKQTIITKIINLYLHIHL